MLITLQILITVLVMGITGFLLLFILPATRRQFSSVSDKLILSPFIGMGFYTLLFIFLNTVFKVKINTVNVFTSFGVIFIASVIYLRIKQVVAFDSINRNDFFVLLILSVIFILALKARLINTLYFPNRLVDADPYRHYIRTKALLQTGMLSKWEPLIVGQVPIFEMQGCYVLTSIMSLVSGIDIWFIWKYGSIIVGTSCVLSLYLMVKHIFGGNKAIHFGSVAFLALSPIHIFRTDIGFAESYALPFLPLAILFFLLFMEKEKYEWAILFGFFFILVAENNPLIAELIFPLFFIFGLYMLVKKRNLRLVTGTLIAIIFCFIFLVIWVRFYLGVSLLRGGTTIGRQAGYYLQKDKELSLVKEAIRWIGGWTLILAIIGLIHRLFKPMVSWGKEEATGIKYGGNFQSANVFFAIFFFLYPILYYCTLSNLFAIPGAQLYRYFSIMAFCFTVFAGIGSVQIIQWLATAIRARINVRKSIWVKIIPNTGYSILAILLFIAIYKARPKTFWLMGPTEEEFVACDWVKQNMSLSAIFAVHWYTGDFVRSLTDRRIVISPAHRVLVRDAIELNKLWVPVLKNPDEVVEFARGVAEPVYLFKSQYGPWFDLRNDLRFHKILETGTEVRKKVTIYEVLKAPTKGN